MYRLFALVLVTYTCSAGVAQTVPGAASDSEPALAADIKVGDARIEIGTSNADSTARTPAQNENVCANVYTFSPDEQLIACCACRITREGVVSLSLRADLIGSIPADAVPTSVIMRVVSATGTTCNAARAATSTAQGDELVAWLTPIQGNSPSALSLQTRAAFSNTTLKAAELSQMTSACRSIQENGNSFGICRSCRIGAADGYRVKPR